MALFNYLMTLRDATGLKRLFPVPSVHKEKLFIYTVCIYIYISLFNYNKHNVRSGLILIEYVLFKMNFAGMI